MTAGKPFAIERMKVVGIATLSDEVLPDGIYYRYRIIVSDDVAARHDCLPDAPGSNATFQQALEMLAPTDCATQYVLYSLSIRGGDRGVNAALDAFSTRSAALTAKLPKALQEQNIGYTLVGKTTARDEQDRVDRSITPITTALFVLAGSGRRDRRRHARTRARARNESGPHRAAGVVAARRHDRGNELRS